MPAQRITRGKADAIERLNEQLRFIHTSGEAFDKGDEAEAKRISAALRIIWKGTDLATAQATRANNSKKGRAHQRAITVALYHQVGFSGDIVDTSILGPTSTDERILVAWGGWRPIPLFSTLPHRRISFDEWWKGCAIKANSTIYTRKDIVLAMAEMDGGAHVDDEIADWYYGITREGAHGMNQLVPIEGSDSYQMKSAPSPVGAIVRQIGHETLMTLAENYRYDGTSHFGNGPGLVWAEAELVPLSGGPDGKPVTQKVRII